MGGAMEWEKSWMPIFFKVDAFQLKIAGLSDTFGLFLVFLEGLGIDSLAPALCCFMGKT